jgi:hypothetical protein
VLPIRHGHCAQYLLIKMRGGGPAGEVFSLFGSPSCRCRGCGRWAGRERGDPRPRAAPMPPAALINDAGASGGK